MLKSTVFNPNTGRYVKRNGKIGQEILAAQKEKKLSWSAKEFEMSRIIRDTAREAFDTAEYYRRKGNVTQNCIEWTRDLQALAELIFELLPELGPTKELQELAREAEISMTRRVQSSC